MSEPQRRAFTMRSSRPARRLAVGMLVVSGFLVLTSGSAGAHPLGNFTISRFSGLEVSLHDVTIHYVVDMAEIPTFQALQDIDRDRDDAVSATELHDYAERAAPALLEGVNLSADRDAVRLSLARAAASLREGQGGLDVLRLEADFSAPLPSSRAMLHYADSNYPGRIGWREIVAYARGGQGIASSDVPSTSVSNELRSYPKDLLSSPLDVREATVEVSPGARVDGGDDAAGGGRLRSPEAFGGSFASLIEREPSPGFVALAVALAAGFGALHALGPGHGKTVMAAYLVGGGGRIRHAVTVAIAVSLMHTASVVVLGVLTLWASDAFPPEAVYPWLSLAAGVVVFSLGVYLLIARLRARGRHEGSHGYVDRPAAHASGSTHDPVHDHGRSGQGAHNHAVHNHAPHDTSSRYGVEPEQHAYAPAAHDHGPHDYGVKPGQHGHAPAAHDHGPGRHTHGPREGDSPLSAKGLAAVALSGGLLPSPTALVVLLGAVALHRVLFGIALVAAFSVGLAAALAVVGIAVLRARSFADRRLGAGVGAVLPIVSAAAICVVGAYLTARALLSL